MPSCSCAATVSSSSGTPFVGVEPREQREAAPLQRVGRARQRSQARWRRVSNDPASPMIGKWLYSCTFGNYALPRLPLLITRPSPRRCPPATIEVRGAGRRGSAVRDAVVYAVPEGRPFPLPRKTAVMDQKNRMFIPHVLAVQTGTAVRFPNSDDIRHHVYSFSPAKPFQLPLYKGTPANPVVFDAPGVVTLGCNIHDQMSAFIVVVDTPYFERTGGERPRRVARPRAGQVRRARLVSGDARRAAAAERHGRRRRARRRLVQHRRAKMAIRSFQTLLFWLIWRSWRCCKPAR